MTRRSVLNLTIAAALAGMMLPGPASAAEPLGVVATTGMIADAARRIGGDLVEVRALMGPGVDPHSYRQTRSDIVALIRADLVLSHGLYLEAQMEQFLGQLGERSTVVPVADTLPPDRLFAHATYQDKYDPHVWMSPELWADVLPAIRDALIAARPDGEATFRANADEYRAEIEALAAYTAEIMASIPAERRVLVTAHDAFSYFGRTFDVEVMGIQGISTESEAGLARIEALVDTLVSRQIQAVFVETSVSDRNMRALVEGARARGHRVTIGGELYSDAMGEPGTYEGTYLGMIDHNATTIARALGGTAPERGRLGKLGAAS
ncbi:zinc ABC transporter substrate-binding protein [Acuticoccus sp. M5D2P5]|uniref:metal ABC transporter solute-binding protein, Zn/Mn family n=1 Tax=Acuticoccus kalidii TaxID=2910977 RepID=UPI001F3F0929|nr:zinc ABC transporter substrate-binding protein [Acuticoccus kalidii]MCF3935773.1 zinc ABC transporter substrate-binding protein [Acuticoccus kalidii]